ncbi:MAG: DUF4157 domain-containing protein [Cyanobacteria bacterium P01_D01_bin.44]
MKTYALRPTSFWKSSPGFTSWKNDEKRKNNSTTAQPHPQVQALQSRSRFAAETTARMSTPVGVQRKLMVGTVGDRYEQEADRVAARVVKTINSPQGHADRTNKDIWTSANNQGSKAALQRKWNAPTPVALKPVNHEIRLKDTGTGEQSAFKNVATEINSAKGSGQPLNSHLQSRMGQAMGTDFSGVRVHTDGKAAKLSTQLRAKAFTTGQDIFFKRGAYQPQNRGGQALIAHELTHVMQQMSPRKELSSQNREHSKSLKLAVRAQNTNGNIVVQRQLDEEDKYIEKTENKQYFIDTNSEQGDRRKLYSRVGANPPEPIGLYKRGKSESEQKTQLNTWEPNIAFTRKSPNNETKKAEKTRKNFNRNQLKEIIKNIQPGKNDAPKLGIVGDNDCAKMANAIHDLIEITKKDPENDSTHTFNNKDNSEISDPKYSELLTVTVGDQWIHRYDIQNKPPGDATTCSYHSATVVATDGTDAVTLEAHAGMNNLLEPKFHVRRGGPEGFVEDNINYNPTPDNNEPREWLGKKVSVTRGVKKELSKLKENYQKRASNVLEYGDTAYGIVFGDNQDQLTKLDQMIDQVQKTKLDKKADKKKADKKCYITTACMRSMNKPDDCDELQTLRRFRDEYIRKQPKGDEMINAYYEHAPRIVARINSSDDEEEIYLRLYGYITDCVVAIKNGDYEQALRMYQEMVVTLNKQYIEEDELST